MIEAKLTLLQVEVEGTFMNPSKAEQPRFGKTPETLNPIHMDTASDKFIPAMIDPEMLPIAHINQPVIPSPPIRVDHTVQGDLPANNRLQRGFPAVRYEFRVDVPIALEDAKANSFAIGSTTSPRHRTATGLHRIQQYAHAGLADID